MAKISARDIYTCIKKKCKKVYVLIHIGTEALQVLWSAVWVEAGCSCSLQHMRSMLSYSSVYWWRIPTGAWSLPPGTPCPNGGHEGPGARMPFIIAQTAKSAGTIHTPDVPPHEEHLKHWAGVSAIFANTSQVRGAPSFMRCDGGWRVEQELTGLWLVGLQPERAFEKDCPLPPTRQEQGGMKWNNRFAAQKEHSRWHPDCRTHCHKSLSVPNVSRGSKGDWTKTWKRGAAGALHLIQR